MLFWGFLKILSGTWYIRMCTTSALHWPQCHCNRAVSWTPGKDPWQTPQKDRVVEIIAQSTGHGFCRGVGCCDNTLHTNRQPWTAAHICVARSKKSPSHITDHKQVERSKTLLRNPSTCCTATTAARSQLAQLPLAACRLSLSTVPFQQHLPGTIPCSHALTLTVSPREQNEHASHPQHCTCPPPTTHDSRSLMVLALTPEPEPGDDVPIALLRNIVPAIGAVCVSVPHMFPNW